MKLHLGCGKRFMPGFVHVDLADYKHIDHRCDVRVLPMFRDFTASLIYASHVVEYFNRDEVVGVLREWHRILKKGGTLRLSVPDFEALVRVYIEHHKDLDLVHGPLYGKWEIPGTGKIIHHKTVYDFRSLRIMLEEAGFVNIRRWDWRKIFVGENKNFDDFSQAYVPHMDKENGILISLNVEADR